MLSRTRRKLQNTAEIAYTNFSLTLAKACLVLLLVLAAMVSINQETVQEGIIPNAEYVIILKWPDKLEHDLDLWVKIPSGKTIWYSSKNHNLVNLERDDLGTSNDFIMVDGKRIDNDTNQEMVSIRGIVPGTYVITAFFYKYKTPDSNGSVPNLGVGTPVEPFTIEVQIIKLNPVVSVEYTWTGTMTLHRQELYVADMIISMNGLVTIDRTIPKSLVSDFYTNSFVAPEGSF